MQLLGGITPEVFLRDYWQKKPLLIRQAYPDFECPVSPDELAGLACEPMVESRIVMAQMDGKPWQLQQGPFDEAIFAELPEKDWTLLVQGLDHWVPEIADLLSDFRFIPNWRLDNVMASFAPVGGSVGPHYDFYDVFLLQAQGTRRWQVGEICNADSPRLDGTPLRILKDFKATETWELAPGDMLYLPPQYAHWGVAVDDCITLSIGFRAPTHDEIITAFCDHLCSLLPAGLHYTDPNLTTQDNPGALTEAAIDGLQAIVTQHLGDRSQLVNWFGCYATEPKHEGIVEPVEEPISEAALIDLLEASVDLRWNEGSRFAYFPDTAAASQQKTQLFVDGQQFLLAPQHQTLAHLLCRYHYIPAEALQPWIKDQAAMQLLTQIYNQGSLYEVTD